MPWPQPPCCTLYAGLAVTSATVVLYGAPIVDPVQLLGKMEGLVPICVSLFGEGARPGRGGRMGARWTTWGKRGVRYLLCVATGRDHPPLAAPPPTNSRAGLMWATLTTNIAANVVAPANAFVNVSPKHVSFNAGAVLTAVLGAAIMPWKLVQSTSSFINTWLVGYSVVLGPVIGIIMADYFLVRRRWLDIDALYTSGPKSAYWYRGGWNPAALAAMVLGVLPCLPGLLQQVGLLQGLAPAWKLLYDCSMFVGVGVGAAAYSALMRGVPGAFAEPPPQALAPAQ